MKTDPRPTRERPAAATYRGPRILGALREFRSDQLGTLERMAALGNAVCFRILHQHHHLITEPAQIEHVVVTGAKRYGKEVSGYVSMRKMLGNGLLTSDGAFWRRQRRIAQPAFRKPRIDGFGEIMAAAAEDMVSRWRDGETIDLEREMMRVALRVAGLTLLSRDLSAEIDEFREALDVGVEYINYDKETPWAPPLWVPTRRNRRFCAALDVYDRVVGNIIAERRATRARSNDLLDVLMHARDPETGEGMSDRQLRDEVMTIIAAGHETTGAALTWAFHLLARHPQIEGALRAELGEVLGGRTPTAEDLPSLTYNERVVHEVLRLYPTVWIFARSVEEDDDILGYPVRRGDWVILSPWITQRRPDLWPDPECFDPDRFVPERVAARHRYAYFPFGGGQRKCIGDRFALTEARLVLATVLQRVRLEALYDGTPEIQPQISIRSRGVLPMRVTRLSSRSAAFAGGA
jgi:cytochrome P450